MKPPVPSDPAATALLARMSGATLASERLGQVVAAYGPILEEIARLRELDLRDVHPAVLFEPTAVYRRQE